MSERSRTPRRLLGLCTLLLVALLALAAEPRPAEAHGYLIRSIPANRAVLARSPTRIQAWFSEGLEARFTTLSLANERGESISLAESGVVPTNTAQVSARLTEPLPDGVYVVTLRVAFASDGHVFTERLIFWVGERAGEVAAESDARTAQPLEVLWRALTLPALTLLFGVPFLYRFVLLPAWGNPRHPAGLLPPRLMSRLSALIWAALAAALFGLLLAVLQQSAVLFDMDIGTVLRDRLWSVVLEGTQIGDAFKFRLAFLALAAAIQLGALYAASRIPLLVSALWTTNLMVAGLALGTISASSHAAGADLWLLLSVLVHWIHVLAEGAWVGGLIALAFLLPVALRPLAESERRAALRAVMRRFAPVGVVAVALLAATGFYNALIHVRQPADMWATSYGLAFVAKLALIVPLLLIGLYHHLTVAQGWLAARLAPLIARYRLAERLTTIGASVRAESAIGILVLCAAALLAATPPPVPPGAGQAVAPPAQALTVGDLTFRLAIDPGAPGPNVYEVTLTRGSEPVPGAQLWARFVYPALDKRTRPLALDDAADGLYINAGPELERAGEWGVWVDAVLPGQQPEQAIRAAFTWPLPETPPTLFIRAPSLLNWLSVALILAVFGLWLGPVTARRLRRLDLQPEAVIIGAALSVVTLIALMAGTVVLANAFERADALRNPPPEIRNPVLADAQSLAAGRAVYEQHCAACHGPSGAGDGPRATEFARLPILGHVVESRRDESIYRTIRDGLGAMPAVDLPEASRWDVIHYLRAPAFFAGAAPGAGGR